MCHVPENCTIPLYPNAAAAAARATLFLVDKVGVHKWYIHKQVVCPSTVNYILSIFKGTLLNLSFGRGTHEQNRKSYELTCVTKNFLHVKKRWWSLCTNLVNSSYLNSLSLSLSLSLYIYIYRYRYVNFLGL
jgi:hypothetical protein